VAFFEELPDPPAPERQPQPAWIGPPGNEAPAAVPLQLVVGRSERAAVLLGGARVYSSGVELEVTMLHRGEPPWHYDPLHLHPGQAKEALLRLAVVCADGSRAEVGQPGFHGGDEERVLTSNGGGGGQGRFTYRLWLWPLPPPGSVEVVCAWPAYAVEETHTSFDAGPMLEAAAQVEVLWPENDEPSGGGSITVHHITPSDDAG
jgi:hypothetical protein